VSGPSDFLRLLEPAVRPDGVAGRAPGAPPPQVPLEGQDFATLLNQARTTGVNQSYPTDSTQPGAQHADESSKPNPKPNPLAQLNDIQNASLLELRRHQHSTATATTNTTEPNASHHKGV